LSAISDTQIELHTDRNQKLAQVEGAVVPPARACSAAS